jgi:signal transduction histidine kinase
VAGRHLGIDVDLPHQPVLVLGDAEQLERVVESLLTNAVKFTEDGGHVQWSLSIENGRAVIDVVDDGIGIAEDEQAHLFTRFFRSRAAQERAIQGSGLGLAIAQWIVHGHGGEISVRSREDVGTSVRVELPLLASHHRLDT